MINRDLIRTKIVQLTYAYYQNGSTNMENAEKELTFSLSKAYDMYILLLRLIVDIAREERRRHDILCQRAEREGAEQPSGRFAYNRFAIQLEQNRMLSESVEAKGLTWEADKDFLRGKCNEIEQTETYRDYMASAEDSYEADREVWRKLYKQLIQDNEDIDTLLEEKSLYWNDDKEIVDTFVLKTINRFDAKSNRNQPLLPEYKDLEDKEMARKLFRATILGADTYQRYMSEASRNWDFSRLAYMDVVIMQIAIAEMLTLPSIPVSVTINEYVELAKLYSTAKSGNYINGMLDHIARHLADKGILLKYIEPKRTREREEGRGKREEEKVEEGTEKAEEGHII